MAKATNTNIMKALVRNTALHYDDRIPEVNKENIASIYDVILDPAQTLVRNQFVDALIGLIVKQRVEKTYFRNPLGVLKKEPMRYGQTEQEIYVNMAKGHTFDMFADATDLFKYYKANVMSAYHQISPGLQYPVSVTFDDLRNAFTDEYGIKALIDAKVESLISGAEYDEYLLTKEIAESAYESGHIYPVSVDAVTDEASARAFTIKMKSYLGQMKFPHPEFNLAGATSSANGSSLYYLTTPEVDSVLEVDILAYAFHNDRAMMDAHKLIVDKFENPAIQAFLFDLRFFNVRENFRTLSNSQNGAALSWNYFYTLSEMFSYSPFFPVVALTTEKIDISTITVNDIEDAVAGNQYTITALASAGTGVTDALTPQNLRYSISGNSSEKTDFVPGSNILLIGKDETATTMTITVTSAYDTSVSGTGTVTMKS